MVIYPGETFTQAVARELRWMGEEFNATGKGSLEASFTPTDEPAGSLPVEGVLRVIVRKPNGKIGSWSQPTKVARATPGASLAEAQANHELRVAAKLLSLEGQLYLQREHA